MIKFSVSLDVCDHIFDDIFDDVFDDVCEEQDACPILHYFIISV